MPKDIIEVLTPFDSTEPVQRMKIGALKTLYKDKFEFLDFGKGGQETACVIINSLYLDFEGNRPRLLELKKRSDTAIVMVFMADLYSHTLAKMPLLSEFVDLFLVPTPEMKIFLHNFTDKEVDVLIDPIDFCLEDSVRTPGRDGPIKVVWFGYPQSYNISMMEYGKRLIRMHEDREIEYHIVTKSDLYGQMQNFVVHEYIADQFLNLLQNFDVCVLSHTPLDFSVTTLWKSENKAVLAINRGLPVVASRTPAYQRLFDKCGLSDYLYSSNVELVDSLRRLHSPNERRRFLDLSQNFVLENYSARKMGEDWLRLYQAARARKPPRRQFEISARQSS